MGNTAQLLASSHTRDTIIIMSADYGLQVMAYATSRPTAAFMGSSVEEAIGKLLFSEGTPLHSKRHLASGKTFEHLGAHALRDITAGRIDIALKFVGTDFQR